MVCCDVVQQQCDDVSISVESRVRDHLVGVTEKADVGEFPFMALVIYNTTENRCGATIISDKFLVSAAHCFKKFLFPIKVRVGTTDADDELARTYDIVKIHRHQRYNSVRRVNDIALIEVRDSIIMSRSVQPICLYTESTELPATQNLTVMGWGVDDTGNRNISFPPVNYSYFYEHPLFFRIIKCFQIFTERCCSADSPQRLLSAFEQG